MKTISIFGATGSIGKSTFNLIDASRENYLVDTITAYENVDALIALANKIKPRLVVIGDDAHLTALRDGVSEGIEVAAGRRALLDAAARPVDWLLNAVIGAAGLEISLRAAGNARFLALANKESLVAGGALLLDACADGKTTLIPVDSEHSAIFQALLGQDRAGLSHITLTASGGPFRDYTLEQMRDVTLEQALKHPNWEMGARITIDSASMFNKALEMIEAKFLFDLAADRIRVIIHPQSIIHSLVAFNDGGQLAQLGLPDMRQPIAFALGYPERLPTDIETLDLAKLARLDFHSPDENRFPALRLAREAMHSGGIMGAVLNAAKETVLDRFISGEIAFLDMAVIVEDVMNQSIWTSAFTPAQQLTLETINAADHKARELAKLSDKNH